MIPGLIGLIVAVLYLGIALFFIIAAWKIFAKAGQPGWGIFVPFYNVYLWIKIAGRPGWWLLLFLIPFVNVVIAIIVALDVAKAFGKSGAFGFFLLFLFGFIGVPILGFGSAVYTAPAAKTA
jgi:hypothetical protein